MLYISVNLDNALWQFTIFVCIDFSMGEFFVFSREAEEVSKCTKVIT